MQQDLFSPSLTEETEVIKKSYDISRLYLVAFFGGAISITILAVINAYWLGIEKKWIRMMVFAGFIVLSLKILLFYLINHNLLVMDDGILKIIYKSLCIAMAYGCAKCMEKRFNLFTHYGGKTKGILQPFLLSLLIAVPVEIGLLFFATL